MSRSVDGNRALRWVATLGLVAAGGVALACAEQQRSAEAPSKASAEEEPQVTEQPTSADAEEDEQDEEEEMACIFIVKDNCFATFEEACSALDCPGGKCEVAPSLPPKVTCRE
jgi:hypothetical protein